jgi:hypothetical protein
MVFHMKTTFNIDDSVMARLREESVRQGKTITELVESALRLLLRQQKSKKTLRELPSFKGGTPKVNIANREALYDLMEEN